MNKRERSMRTIIRGIILAALLLSTLLLTGCSGNIGVGMSVGIPVGSNGYVSVGASSHRWR